MDAERTATMNAAIETIRLTTSSLVVASSHGSCNSP